MSDHNADLDVIGYDLVLEWPLMYTTHDLASAPAGIEYETPDLADGPTIRATILHAEVFHQDGGA